MPSKEFSIFRSRSYYASRVMLEQMNLRFILAAELTYTWGASLTEVNSSDCGWQRAVNHYIVTKNASDKSKPSLAEKTRVTCEANVFNTVSDLARIERTRNALHSSIQQIRFYTLMVSPPKSLQRPVPKDRPRKTSQTSFIHYVFEPHQLNDSTLTVHASPNNHQRVHALPNGRPRDKCDFVDCRHSNGDTHF